MFPNQGVCDCLPRAVREAAGSLATSIKGKHMIASAQEPNSLAIPYPDK